MRKCKGTRNNLKKVNNVLIFIICALNTTVLVMDWIALLDYLFAKSYAGSKILICFVLT